MRITQLKSSLESSNLGLLLARGIEALRRRLVIAVTSLRRTFLRLPPSDDEIIAGLNGMRVRASVSRAIEAILPQNAWHSWDPAPWSHPWLTYENLKAARTFQDNIFALLEERLDGLDARALRYGFVGNLANNMTMRAIPLRADGYNIDIVLHPHDRYVMSEPGWEFSDLLLDGETDVDRLLAKGLSIPELEGVLRPTTTTISQDTLAALNGLSVVPWRDLHPSAAFMRRLDVARWPGYINYLPVLEALQGYDALLAAQAPYLAYLSGRPYLAAQTGGDLWFEAARNDSFGQLQRRSYAHAQAILATNPWSFAHARRYGFDHVIYVPLLVDTERYRPGQSAIRAAWQAQIGGDFFVLATARLDRMWKGSEVGLEGFCRFAEQHPGARLVLIGWGENNSEALDTLKKFNLADRTLLLPISGKLKLIEYLRAADCLLDQFKIGYYGATALEAMACGLPVIMHLLAEQYDALCPTGAPPVLNSATADDVKEKLLLLATSHEQRREFQHRSRRWILENHSSKVWGGYYGALLCAVAHGIPLDFTSSPLRNPLKADEIAYHAKSLVNAPPFPQYLI